MRCAVDQHGGVNDPVVETGAQHGIRFPFRELRQSHGGGFAGMFVQIIIQQKRGVRREKRSRLFQFKKLFVEPVRRTRAD